MIDWNPVVAMTPTLLSPVAPEFVNMATSAAATDGKIVIIHIAGFYCIQSRWWGLGSVCVTFYGVQFWSARYTTLIKCLNVWYKSEIADSGGYKKYITPVSGFLPLSPKFGTRPDVNLSKNIVLQSAIHLAVIVGSHDAIFETIRDMVTWFYVWDNKR